MSAPLELRAGVVVEFDPRRGIGVIAEPDGARWPFHCTALVDDTRLIEPDASVVFSLGYGHLGRRAAEQVIRCRAAAPHGLAG